LGDNLEPVLIKPDLIILEFRTGFNKTGFKIKLLEPILAKSVRNFLF
jgi:hypothetical protein